MAVEDQVAIIFASTKGMLDTVPENRVREFETEYLSLLNAQHRGTLDQLKAGKLTDEVTETLGTVARDLAKKFAK